MQPHIQSVIVCFLENKGEKIWLDWDSKIPQNSEKANTLSSLLGLKLQNVISYTVS
jgi:hypothetical protein